MLETNVVKISEESYALLLSYHFNNKKTQRLKQILLKNLNANSSNYSFDIENWMKILNEWIMNIDRIFDMDLDIITTTRYSKEDIELFFNRAQSRMNSLPRDEEIFTILEHLEVVSETSNKLWDTIALELVNGKKQQKGAFWKNVRCS